MTVFSQLSAVRLALGRSVTFLTVDIFLSKYFTNSITMCVPFVPRLLEQCHDVESNPGPLRPGTNKSSSSSSSNSSTSYASMRRARQQHQQQQERQQRQQQQHSASLLDDGELEMGLGNSRVDRLGEKALGKREGITQGNGNKVVWRRLWKTLRPIFYMPLNISFCLGRNKSRSGSALL